MLRHLILSCRTACLIALLAGLPQAPALYNPLVDLEAALRRQRVVLDLMVKHGTLSKKEADLAAGERLRFEASPFPIRAPHFVWYAWSTLERDLGVETLAQGGYEVYTTLDVDLQETGEAIIRRRLAALQERGGPDRNVNNAALLALDPHTGEILVMVGSADYFDGAIGGAVNASLALRQPGSAIKPITYAVALDPAWKERPDEAVTRWGVLPFTPATLIADVRTSFITREGVGYVPLNYDLRWHGPVLLREALGSSYNLPAVKVLDAVGLERMVDEAERALNDALYVVSDVAETPKMVAGGGSVEMEMSKAVREYAAQVGGRVLNVQAGTARVVGGGVAPQYHLVAAGFFILFVEGKVGRRRMARLHIDAALRDPKIEHSGVLEQVVRDHVDVRQLVALCVDFPEIGVALGNQPVGGAGACDASPCSTAKRLSARMATASS